MKFMVCRNWLIGRFPLSLKDTHMMDPRALTVTIAYLAALACCLHCEEAVHSTGLNGVNSNDMSSMGEHLPEKRSVMLSPMDEEDEILLNSDGYVPSSYSEGETNKRGTLFRFGKRQGSLLRFGKRGSLFRFGKRQGSLFRFGKRGGTLFRFGRGGPTESSFDDNSMAEKRTLFRFGKRSDLDLLRNALAQYEYDNRPVYLEDVGSKRQVDGFHWGRETEGEK